MAKTRWGTMVAATLAAALVVSCSSQDFGGDQADCDYIILPGISDGGTVPVSTLVCDNSFVPMDMAVNVRLRSPTEGGLGEPPEPTALAQFNLTHYDVTYRNLTTGGSTPGVDVPYPFRQTVASIFDMREEEEVEYEGFPIMAAGAKTTAPLNDDRFYPNDAGVLLEATLTWWGYPINDQGAWCSETMTWTFSVVPC